MIIFDDLTCGPTKIIEKIMMVKAKVDFTLRNREYIGVVNRDGKLYIILQERRAIHMRTAILENRINDIRKFQTKPKQVNLNADRKRFWFTPLPSINVKVCCESLPLSLVYFTQKHI